MDLGLCMSSILAKRMQVRSADFRRIMRPNTFLNLKLTLRIGFLFASFKTIKAKSDVDATVSDRFVQTGMAGVDGFPDSEKLLCTCQRFLTIDEVTVHKIKSNMPLLLEEHSAHGFVSDMLMRKIRLPEDEDLDSVPPNQRDTFVLLQMHHAHCVTNTLSFTICHSSTKGRWKI